MTSGPACWEVKRDAPGQRQAPSTYFDDARIGAHCSSNWYEGNVNRFLGRPEARVPKYLNHTRPAPALLGFDETIDEFCRDELSRLDLDHRWKSEGWAHAENCIRANLNILALYGNRVPYNVCRNLEWMVCAANGWLPGQQGVTIKFAKAPGSLYPFGRSGKPIDRCCGWAPTTKPKGGVYGYTTDDIFYLEVCLFHEICENGADLFNATAVGEDFSCQFSDRGFRELQQILLSPWEEPEGSTLCQKGHVCPEHDFSTM